MSDYSNIIKSVKQKVSADLNKKFETTERNERLMYAIPYNSIPITAGKSDDEVALTLNNVILVVKEKKIDQYDSTERNYEIYDENAQKIAMTEDDGRIKFDREILDDLIKSQIKAIEDAGLIPAGADTLDDQGRIESYFEMINRTLVIMNKEQKQKYEEAKLKGEGDKCLKDISERNMSPQKNKEVAKNMEQEEAKNHLEQDLGIKVRKSTLIDDDLFFENNPDIKSQYVFAVLTDDEKLQIVAENNGKFEPVKGFEGSSNQSGRTSIIRNDEEKIETKNTYGSIKSTEHPDDIRYTAELGTYGEIKLLEQKRNTGASLEESDKWLSREVETQNTDFSERNLEGNTINNITRQSFSVEHGYNDDSHYLGTNKKIKEINKHRNAHGDVDFNFESLAESTSLKVNEAIEDISNKLKEKGSILNSKDEEKIRADLTNQIENSDIIYCDELIEQYTEEFIKNKKQKDKVKENDSNEKEKTEDEGRNRLDEIMEQRMNRNKKG